MSYPYPYGENYSTPTSARTSYPWEVEQSQDPSSQTQQAQAYSPTGNVQLPEPHMIVPSQQREDVQHQPYRVQPVHGSEGRLEYDRPAGDTSTKPQVHVDTTHRSGSSSISPVSSIKPMRPTPTRAHSAQIASHPYKRPQSSAGRPRREYEQHVRFAAPTSGSIASPASLSRVTSIGSNTTESPLTIQADSTRRFIIRTDVHYDVESKVITAMLELPGLKKTDMSITLSTCLYNRVKQVTIAGKSKPVFPESGYTVRERKFGEFNRTLAVPPETTSSDVQAEMQDGILVVKISCGMPAESENAEDIPIR